LCVWGGPVFLTIAGAKKGFPTEGIPHFVDNINGTPSTVLLMRRIAFQLVRMARKSIPPVEDENVLYSTFAGCKKQSSIFCGY
jgi:hypothetical protein